MLEAAKRACRVTAAAYDDEIKDLIAGAKADLAMTAGIPKETAEDENNPLVRMAIKTYCRAHFGSPPNYAQLKTSYDEQKAQLQSATAYAEGSTDAEK